MKVIKILNIESLVIVFTSILFLGSCNENSLDSAQVTTKSFDQIETINDMSSVMHGALNRMTLSSYYGRDFIIYGDALADNTFANGNSGRFTSVSANLLNSNSTEPENTWSTLYKVISSANLMISSKINYGVNEQGRYNHLLGEAYFFRALAHFDVLRYYGQQNVDISAGKMNMNALGVPYEKTFRPDTEIKPKRIPVFEVKKLLYEDIEKSIQLMDPSYDYGDIAYVNSLAAKALFVRMSLYFGDYDNVINIVEPIVDGISSTDLLSISDYPPSWATKKAKNWIFALNNNESDNLGNDGLSYIFQDTGYGDIVAYDLGVSVFEVSDVRKTLMIKELETEGGRGKFFRNYGKYPLVNPPVYQIPLFRIEELIYSYAEALYFKGRTTEAIKFFNYVISNRGASPLTSISEDIIVNEWRKEFYFEGFRLHTLARFSKGIKITSNGKSKDIPYGDYRFALPIPQSEINRSSLKQNKGY